MDSWEHLLTRITTEYFSDPSRRLSLNKGDVLMDQDVFNNRLYYILQGTFAGTIRTENELGEEQQLELFRATQGEFLGVTSFFSRTMLSSTRVTCLTDGELAWIDRQTPPVREQEFGGLRKQFIPLIIEELSHRQMRLSQTTREREIVLRRLHMAEKLSTLGQLSTGLAHELNNAVGVLARSSDHLMQVIETLLRKHEPELAHWFELGAEKGQQHGSDVIRRKAKALAQEHHLDYETAKTLARVIGEAPLPTLPDNLEAGLALWETGRDCYDMQLAARHATSLVRSVKQLGGGGQTRQEGIDINETFTEALALMQSELRQVSIIQHFAPDLPLIWGNKSELVQIWINIIKNGCDALKETRTSDPCITLTTLQHNKRTVEAVLANNGPQIPTPLLSRLFQPNITTKKGATGTMGLGLGLCIVKRIVDSYSGELMVESEPTETRFRVILPLQHESVEVD